MDDVRLIVEQIVAAQQAAKASAVPPDEKPNFQFVQGASYLALKRDPVPWIIEKLVPSGGLMNLFGKPKLGKSFAGLGIACAIADENCDNWLGFKVLKHGKVAYLQIDTPRGEWAERVEMLQRTSHSIDNIYFTDANLTPYPLNITDKYIKDALKESLKAFEPILLVVDTLREVHEGDENDSGQMKKVITGLVECTKDIGCGLLLISHSRKENIERGEDIMNDGRGSSYTAGRMDIVAKLTEKHIKLKGRSIGETTISIEQDHHGMIQLNAEKAENEANIKYVLAQPNLSQRQQGELLASLEDDLEPDAARSRIKRYLAKRAKEHKDGKGQTDQSEA